VNDGLSKLLVAALVTLASLALAYQLRLDDGAAAPLSLDRPLQNLREPHGLLDHLTGPRLFAGGRFARSAPSPAWGDATVAAAP